MKKVLTLCIIYQETKVLLGMKKIGHGVGKWNGFGGKVEAGESIEEAAKREVREEAGLRLKSIEKIGVIDFEFQDGSQSLELHIFWSNEFEGEIIESDEMAPQWFDADTLPFADMWPEDIYWMPMLLSGKKFKGVFVYDHPSNPADPGVMISKVLKEIG